MVPYLQDTYVSLTLAATFSHAFAIADGSIVEGYLAPRLFGNRNVLNGLKDLHVVHHLLEVSCKVSLVLRMLPPGVSEVKGWLFVLLVLQHLHSRRTPYTHLQLLLLQLSSTRPEQHSLCSFLAKLCDLLEDRSPVCLIEL